MIKVLVVDDSALMRRQLQQIFTEAGGYEVLTARDGQDTLDKLARFAPDVITLDINMPVMDGLTCLSHIMAQYPCPVIMVSSLTDKGALATFEALELGAFDYITKPGGTVSLNLKQVAEELLAKVQAAIKGSRKGSTKSSVVQKLSQRLKKSSALESGANSTSARLTRPPVRLKTNNPISRSTGSIDKLVLIGVSTGGPGTVERIITSLPADFSWPILIAQHMPSRFTAAFAERLDQISLLPVSEVTTPTSLQGGQVYIAKGDADVKLVKRAGQIKAVPQPMHPEHLWHPSVSLMVASALEVCAPQQLICVQLTGMGYDGAEEMAQAHRSGALTIAESEESAVVYGMPKVLIDLNGATEILPHTRIAAQLVQWEKQGRGK
ncbi:MAG: chemotaxis protein CheB [Marinospirillum sp.]|uniref:chemotaxis protein CheB n=1 Tax=Marinospirillum sp. TaxID=2183934 RepID=UPI001A05A706|nr:chemotaxis protein CheB [Marinospirillum sp.]MBE0505177.1 chemotaxis protein CheB [Marinospirillum sp.]